MSASVETMMYVREKPWHGLGTQVEEAPTSADALPHQRRRAPAGRIGLDGGAAEYPGVRRHQDFQL